MSISSVPRQGRCPGAALLLSAGLAVVLAAAAGCARLSAEPPEPPSTRRTVAAAGAKKLPASPAGAPVTAAPVGSPPTPALSQRPPIRDPGEEITPEELATISEPVPAPLGVEPRVDPRTPAGGPEGAAQTGSVQAESVGGRPASLWRVQIFVTQDRALADRKAAEGVERLQAQAHVAYEPPYYKVRLGGYTSEVEAQPLREKALYSGYPGAFRVRCVADTTYKTD